MDTTHLSNTLRAALQDAEGSARKLQHGAVEQEHLLLAMILHEGSFARGVVEHLKVSVFRLAERLQRALQDIKRAYGTARPYPSMSLEDVLDAAKKIATKSGSTQTESDHVLLAILDARASNARTILRTTRVHPDGVTQASATLRQTRSSEDEGAPFSSAPNTPHANTHTQNTHTNSGAQYTPNPPPASTSAGPRASTRSLNADAPASTAPAAKAIPGAWRSCLPNYPTLSRYAIDLTAQAQRGELDPMMGRDAELRKMLQVLTRRGRNNPILVGENGVGKTSIIEGFAQRIVAGDVPEHFKSVTIVSLDFGALVSGARLRGDLEGRLKNLITEIKQAAGKVLLFINELHVLVGGEDSGIDVSSVFKPALTKGIVQIIGTSTSSEYQLHIENDRALARRFQVLAIDEPNAEQAISILRGVKRRYEAFHKVEIRDEAIRAAVTLTSRYVTDRQLPEKAIDCIDEAASRLRLEIESVPDEIHDLERAIINFEREISSLKFETDPDSVELRDEMETTLAEKRSALKTIQAQWKKEQSRSNSDTTPKDLTKQLQARLQKVEIQIKEAQDAGDKITALELKQDLLIPLRKSLRDAKATQEASGAANGQPRLVEAAVGAKHISDVISSWTGIPIDQKESSQREKLQHIEEELGARVIGQPDAVAQVANAVRRSSTGLQDPNRPLGSFIFLGPTGVGKTELAKALASYLFEDENAIIRLDMSEFMEKNSVNRITGPPPGYVGYEAGGELTGAVRARPYSVVLFDEVEKAHPDVFNILLQLLDDGRLTDNKYRVIDFKNTVVIMTSNLGSHHILRLLRTDPSQMKEKVMEALEEHFRPEFLARIDAKIIFNALSFEDAKKILKIQLKRLQKLLTNRKLTIELTPAAFQWLAEEGYEPEFGARPLKKAILDHIQNPLAIEFLSREYPENSIIFTDIHPDGERLSFECRSIS